MRYSELLMEEEKEKGTFVGVHFSDETNKALMAYVEENDIPNPIVKDELHVTICYSRKTIDYDADGDLDITITPHKGKLNIWETKDKKHCLVWKFESDELTARHDACMDLGASHDFDEYQSHVTLSYDVPADFDVDFPLPDFDLEIAEEYSSALDKDWGK